MRKFLIPVASAGRASPLSGSKRVLSAVDDDVVELIPSGGAGTGAGAGAGASAGASAGGGAGAQADAATIAQIEALGLSSSLPAFDLLVSQSRLSYWRPLMSFLKTARASGKKVYPPPGRELAAQTLCGSLRNIRVVILGQDPYHGPGQAHGLAFSVPTGVAAPPSLKNILKEVGVTASTGNLESWARQGVLLLNTALTVFDGEANSHAGKGWEVLSDNIISAVAKESPSCCFMLWGAPAQKKRPLIKGAGSRHLVLEAPHPSPLSAYRGFIGCAHFTKANEFLLGKGLSPIDWKL